MRKAGVVCTRKLRHTARRRQQQLQQQAGVQVWYLWEHHAVLNKHGCLVSVQWRVTFLRMHLQ